MTHPYTPSPEMLEVLAEVERNPRSVLLRPNRNLGAPLNYDEQVTGSEPFMTSAERKLVRAYREEMGAYLYYQGVVLIGATDWARARLINNNNRESLSLAIQVAQSKGRSKILRKSFEESSSGDHPDLEGVESYTPLECFNTSNRLWSKDSAKIMIGCAQLEMGFTSSAETILAQVLGAGTDIVCRSHAALNLGLAYWQKQRFDMSAKLYQWAEQLGPESFHWLGFGLVSRAFTGDWNQVVRLEKRLTSLGFHSEHPSVCFSVLQQTRGQEMAAAQGLSYVLPRELPRALGELSRTILKPYSPGAVVADIHNA